ncbi:MAG: pilus assembly protein TadG-related protein [Chloroflexota bacterium]
MRIIFITPLLWKRLDRAVRRREEGQALILVAMATVAMVAMVGLAVDGGLAYLEAQKLQRAADSAALAGVVWVPSLLEVADGRGKLSANASGYYVYRDTGTNPANNWTYDEVMAAEPGKRVLYKSSIPKENQYTVTLGRLAQRYFLGVIGLGDYYIQRTSTAEYSRLVKLGSSFNYLGSSGVLYDPSVNAGNDANDTYARYVTNRCMQLNPPTPCVGTFWSSIGGTDWIHVNGDAYNPINEGVLSSPSTIVGANGTSYSVVNNQSTRANKNCDHAIDPNSWFVSSSAGINNGLYSYVNAPPVVAGSCEAAVGNQSPYPVVNQDIHPDSGQRRNFGYEVGIQVDARALKSGLAATDKSHTNVNVSIYDAAMAPFDGQLLYGNADRYDMLPGTLGQKDTTGKASPSDDAPLNGTYPLSPFYIQRYITAASKAYSGTVTSGPVLDTINGICPDPAGVTYPAAGTYASTDAAIYAESMGLTWRRCLSQYWITTTNAIINYNNTITGTGTGVTFGAGQPYRLNELRTRYTLYYPPQADGVNSVYANVAVPGGRIGAFEVGDMSIRTLNIKNLMPIEREPDPAGDVGTFAEALTVPPKGLANQQGAYNSYCYIVSLNPPVQVTTDATGFPKLFTANANTSPISLTTGYTPPLTTIQSWNDTQFTYVCPSSTFDYGSGSTVYAKDYYWGMPFPTASYPGLTVVNSFNNQGKQSAPINNVVTDWTVIPAGTPDPLYPLFVKPASTKYIDPGQECRISVSSAPGVGVASPYGTSTSPIEPLYDYGSPRMPFNAAYGDRLNTYTYSGTTGGSNGTPTGTWQYWSRHGWRCNWDFDSDYDPRFNPLKPGGNEPLDMSGYGSNDTTVNRPATNNGNSYYGNGRVEPFFHLTDWTWAANGNSRVLKKDYFGNTVVPGTSNAMVRPGTYMLHVQTYGGSGANRFAVKAEYENALDIAFTIGYNCVPVDCSVASGITPITTTIKPVPNVSGITTFSIYTNAQNPKTTTADVVFDLAYIPPENAGSTAILQLFDPGEGQTSKIQLSLREPAPTGNRLTVSNTVMIGDPITFTATACPYFLNNRNNCTEYPTTPRLDLKDSTYSYYNDYWLSIVFQIPNKQAFDTYLSQCNTNKVPEEACYYFQVDYEQGQGFSNDTTTWQLVVQGAPVHLLK